MTCTSICFFVCSIVFDMLGDILLSIWTHAPSNFLARSMLSNNLIIHNFYCRMQYAALFFPIDFDRLCVCFRFLLPNSTVQTHFKLWMGCQRFRQKLKDFHIEIGISS